MGRIKQLTRSVLVVALLCGAAGSVLAQQPAQRILPRVSPPSDTPYTQSPCLPHLDDDLQLYVRPCQQFHRSGPPHDWLDRMLVAVTWPRGAQWLVDLAPDERTHIKPHQRGESPHPPSLTTTRRAELTAAVQAIAARWSDRLARQRRQPVVDAAGPPLDSQRLADKRAGLAPDVCPLRWLTEQADVPLTAPLTLRLEARRGEAIHVETLGLSQASGYLAPDPVFWLVRVTAAGDPEQGTVVATFNSEAGTLPVFDVTAPDDGLYRLIVAPFRPEFAGFIALEARVDGLAQARVDHSFFGGTLLQLRDVVAGDTVFAGAVAQRQGHDAVLTLLPPPGNTLPLPYVSSNNHIGTLPLLAVPDGVEETWLLVSAFDADHRPAVAVNISRIGKRSSGGTDRDGDGLSEELEKELGTCDRAEDEGCGAPSPRPSGWSPDDTDGDGFTDFEELHGVRKCYAARPQPPRFSVSPCIKDGRGRCVSVCPPDTAFMAQVPLSALDSPSPLVHDIYLEMDYWTDDPVKGVEEGLTEDQVALVKRTFEARVVYSDEAPEGKFEATEYPIAFHLFQDEPLAMPGFEGMSRLPALPARSLYFNLFFSADRKYTNTFHYLVGTNKGGGQSDVTGRAAIVGLSGGTGAALKLAHEVGHLLGLLHNHRYGNPDHTPFNLSIMSYGYVHTPPPLITWDGTFRPCSENNPCPDFLRCATFQGHGQLCAPDCGVAIAPDGSSTHFGHFSSDLLELPPDTAEAGYIPEEGYPIGFLPYLYCYDNGGKTNRHIDRFRRFSNADCPDHRCVQCIGDRCRIDLDQDGDFDGLRGYDLDRDGKVNENPLNGGDDYRLLMARGPRGLRILSKGTLVAFYTGFADNVSRNHLPYPAVTHEQHAGFVREPTNRCDEVARWSHCRDQARNEAALFRGPVSGDRGLEVKLPSDFCLDGEKGQTFSLRVKPFQAPTGDDPVVLAQTENVRLLLDGPPDELTWIAEIPGQEGPMRLKLADGGALGHWTRVTVALDTSDKKAYLSIRRRTVFRLEERQGLGTLAPVCELTVGAASGQNATFMGLLDDPLLVLGYVKGLR